MERRRLALAIVLSAAVYDPVAAQEDTAARAAAQRRAAQFRVPAEWFIPKEVDSQDDKLRLLLLVPGGPLLIEVRMAVDGKPYPAFFEGQIDQVVKGGDRDGDGKLTWDSEGIGLRLPGRRLALPKIDQEIWGNALDLDQDGIASRYELRRLLCLAGGGPSLVVGSPQGNPLTAEACFQKLADKDGDGILSANELAQLPQRLRLRDANDNELVDSYELLGAKADARQISRTVSPAALVLLAADTDWGGLANLLKTKYGAGSGSLGTGEPRLSGLTSALDTNGDRSLDDPELRRLMSVEPDLRVEVNLGESEPKPPGAFIRSVSDSLRKSAKISPLPEDKLQMMLEITGLRLAVSGLSAPASTTPFASMARSYMARYDKDKNGYLDEKELPRQYTPADVNGDKKVYEEELLAFLNEAALFSSNRLSVAVVDEPKELLKLVDRNQDGQLSAREISGAKERLLGLDTNQNGQLEPEEFPGLLRITFARGRGPESGFLRGRIINRLVSSRPSGEMDWFAQMDANGDDEISQREFLGTAEQFENLDGNHDGLLSRTESSSVK